MYKKTFSAGQLIFRQGDTGEVAYLIEQGKVRVFSGNDDQVTIGELGPGSLLGEIAVLDDRPRTASAEAQEETTVAVITRELFTERIENTDPIVQLLIDVLMERFRQSMDIGNGDKSSGAVHGIRRLNQLANEAMDKMRLEVALRHTMEHGQLESVYQPIQDLRSGRISGFENLARWHSEEHGSLPPSNFIALAEETNLILPIGLQMFDNACKTLKKMNRRSCGDCFVGINVSGRQLSEGSFLDQAADIVKQHGVDPSLIKLEITESLVVEYEVARRWVERGHELGFMVALDDFGTGYSGLRHLLELDFDFLKIDQSFVSDMITNRRSEALIRGMVSIAQSLGIAVIAEGVETDQQRDALRTLGVDYAQGFVVGRPMGSAEALATALQVNGACAAT